MFGRGHGHRSDSGNNRNSHGNNVNDYEARKNEFYTMKHDEQPRYEGELLVPCSRIIPGNHTLATGTTYTRISGSFTGHQNSVIKRVSKDSEGYLLALNDVAISNFLSTSDNFIQRILQSEESFSNYFTASEKYIINLKDLLSNPSHRALYEKLSMEKIFASSLEALQHMHSAGFVHRDICLQNLGLIKVEGKAKRLLSF